MSTRIGMSTVTVKKDQLLEVLKSNREGHRGVFLAAQRGYRDAMIKELDTMLLDAREGRAIRRQISLPEPQDYTAAYDRVIRMLEMSVDDTITLTEADFAQYVMDDWDWTLPFRASTALYAGRA